MADWNDNVRYIKGIGEQRAKSLARLGICTLRDLVSYFPRSYEDRSIICPIAEAPVDRPVCVKAMVASTPVCVRVRRGLEILKVRAVDETGALDITFFNQSFLKKQFQPGITYIFYGRINGGRLSRTMANPDFEAEEKQGSVTGRIVPVYRLTAGISPKVMLSAMRGGLEACDGVFPDVLPDEIRQRYQLAQARFSYENIHFPRDQGALEQARQRLVFEELFVLAAALALLRGRRTGQDGLRFTAYPLDEFWSRLPFSPTEAQRRAAGEALADLCSGKPMSRLLQGDVGSGKTLVAAALVWEAVKNGYQAAFMAPTEILADQHFENLTRMLDPYGIRVVKLTGSMTAKQKRQTSELLNLGMADLAIGTHALISESVTFQNLGLVVTDEQHRFGVEQRGALAAKGLNPHVLVMSATPIPRTLALIIYGDLDISVLNELPPGRQKVDTYAVGEDMRPRIWNFVRRLVSDGRQVFIVCPMVEENEALPETVKSAEEHAKHLQQEVFPDLRVACIHGRMKGKDKDAVMAAFAAGEYNILVSTTVIEVGVDVPNAALMIVENTERFGLSQLHQLRGRVGRGPYKSCCVLFSDASNPEARARLDILCRTNDGFEISEEDLRLRGPGDFFGNRQHGLPEMHVADLSADMRVLKVAQEEANAVLRADPTLSHPENKRLGERIDELFEIHGETFN